MDQVGLRVHTNLGKDRRELAPDRAWAHVQVGGDRGHPLALQQQDQDLPFPRWKDGTTEENAPRPADVLAAALRPQLVGRG